MASTTRWLQHLKQRRRILKQTTKPETIHRKICSLIFFLFRYIHQNGHEVLGEVGPQEVLFTKACHAFCSSLRTTDQLQNMFKINRHAHCQHLHGSQPWKYLDGKKIVHHILKHYTYKTRYKFCRISSWSHGDALLTADKLIIIHSGHVERMGERNVYIISIVKLTWRTFYSVY
jgi:hypothetical protein